LCLIVGSLEKIIVILKLGTKDFDSYWNDISLCH